MDVELLPHQVAKLAEIAERTGRGTDESAVDRLLSEEEWPRQQAQVGIDQVERGEFIEEEEMGAGSTACCGVEAYRWSAAAANDLEGYYEYLLENHPLCVN